MRTVETSTGRRAALRPGLLIWSLLFTAAACGNDASDMIVAVPADSQSRAVAASVGQEIRITLGNIGPAIYESPPQISSAAITFLGVDDVAPYTPAGPNQQFRFQAASPGSAVIHFRRLLGDSVIAVVEDTVQVR